MTSILWPSGIAPYIFAAKPPPSLLIPHSSFLTWVELSSPIKEHHAPGPTLNPEPKTFFKNLLTQERQCGKMIPVADEATPFERAMQKISKNHLTNLYECGKIIKSLEERWFFEN